MPTGWSPSEDGPNAPANQRAAALLRVRTHPTLAEYYDKLMTLAGGDVDWAWVATADEAVVSLWLAGLPGERSWPPEED